MCSEDEEEITVATQPRRYPSRSRTLSSAAMERMVNEEIPEFSYEDEKQQDYGTLFLLEDADPTTQSKAYESDCCKEWENAEIEEMASIYQHKVGTLVKREKFMNVLGSRFPGGLNSHD